MKILRVFLILILMTPTILRAEAPAGNEAPVLVKPVGTYDQLLAAVREAKAQTQVRVEKAVEQERVREAWEIGRLIDAHVLQHKERADYDKEVVLRLATDLGMSDSELYRMLKFYRAYPKVAPAPKLSWAHYRELLSVDDPKARKTLVEQAEKENWSRDRLRKEVKALKGQVPASESGPVPLYSKPGKPGTHKIVLAKSGPYAGELAIDLGFSNYVQLAEVVDDVSPFKEGEVVAFSEEEGEVQPVSESRGASPESQLYTYNAYVLRVLDGDTIEAVVDLGFGFTTTQILRFRGIDAPELPTRDGMEAKEFVEKMLAHSPQILIKTVKSDKYDRYLADVYCVDSQGKQVYLNNLLLEKELAVRVGE